MIKAIPTVYNGITYRSRFEARWAVVLTNLGLDFEYESEGFFIDGQSYLPDFLIHHVVTRCSDDCDIFMEVKGVMMPSDLKKIESFSEYRDLVVVSGIPNIATCKDDCDVWRRELNIYNLDNNLFSFIFIDGDNYCCNFGYDHKGNLHLFGSDDCEQWKDLISLRLAYLNALRTRFGDDHGETLRAA